MVWEHPLPKYLSTGTRDAKGIIPGSLLNPAPGLPGSLPDGIVICDGTSSSPSMRTLETAGPNKRQEDL
jgi:hypothetical protein